MFTKSPLSITTDPMFGGSGDVDSPAKNSVRQNHLTQLTKSITVTGKEAAIDLQEQGEMLQTTNVNLDQMQTHLKKAHQDLNEMQRSRSLCGRCLTFFCSPFRILFRCLCCCCPTCKQDSCLFDCLRSCPCVKCCVSCVRRYCSAPKESRVPPQVQPLSEQKIEQDWCRRFDPEERWLRQLEMELDRLISLAEEMRQTCEQQTELGESMIDKARRNKQSAIIAKDKMQQMTGKE